MDIVGHDFTADVQGGNTEVRQSLALTDYKGDLLNEEQLEGVAF